MKQEHIILRSARFNTRDPFLGASMAPTAALVPQQLSVSIEQLDYHDVPQITHVADVLAVAPSIRMRLIKPFDVPLSAQAAATSIAWGVQAVGADTSPFTGDGVVVAVLDTGIDATHPAFAGVELVQRDFTGEGNGDLVGHGTHCAGTIFGRDCDGQRIGVARGVKKALIGKVLSNNGGSSEGIVSAIQWAVENGANVISMSLGIDFPGIQAGWVAQGLPPELATSRALEGYRANVQLFERLASLVQAMGNFSHPVIIVAAAGNESRRDENPEFEISVSPPAVADGIISIAALGQGGSGLIVAPFSNTGANIAGPGVEILSAKVGGGLSLKSGTSMATPHAAGVAALWAQKLKTVGDLSSGALTARIIGTAGYTSLQAGFDVSDIGRGLIQAPQS